jgi:transposase-like protein
MRELSVAEQRYDAVLEVIRDGRTVKDVAAAVGVSRQTLHTWLVRYEDAGLEGLANRSHRPLSCPHQMVSVAEVMVLELPGASLVGSAAVALRAGPAGAGAAAE